MYSKDCSLLFSQYIKFTPVFPCSWIHKWHFAKPTTMNYSKCQVDLIWRHLIYQREGLEVTSRHGLKCPCVAEEWHFTASWPHWKLWAQVFAISLDSISLKAQGFCFFEISCHITWKELSSISLLWYEKNIYLKKCFFIRPVDGR